MTSASHCFQRAAECEALALTASDDSKRANLQLSAAHWRALGNRATRDEAAKNLRADVDETSIHLKG